jgi:hypothetical protein
MLHFNFNNPLNSYLARHLQPFLPILPLLFITAVSTCGFAAAVGGGGPILPHPGFVTLAADPPNVILRAPFPVPPLFTGESLALLPASRSPFSLFPIKLLAENTRFARPGDEVTVPRRFVPRVSVEKSEREDLGRRRC